MDPFISQYSWLIDDESSSRHHCQSASQLDWVKHNKHKFNSIKSVHDDERHVSFHFETDHRNQYWWFCCRSFIASVVVVFVVVVDDTISFDSTGEIAIHTQHSPWVKRCINNYDKSESDDIVVYFMRLVCPTLRHFDTLWPSNTRESSNIFVRSTFLLSLCLRSSYLLPNSLPPEEKIDLVRSCLRSQFEWSLVPTCLFISSFLSAIE